MYKENINNLNEKFWGLLDSAYEEKNKNKKYYAIKDNTGLYVDYNSYYIQDNAYVYEASPYIGEEDCVMFFESREEAEACIEDFKKFNKIPQFNIQLEKKLPRYLPSVACAA